MAENLARQQKTKEKLRNALIELCNTHGYYKTTVDDICKRAGTYRSTFYRYYENKDILLREIEKRYIEDTRKLTTSIRNIDYSHLRGNYDLYKKELIANLEYQRERKQLYIFLLSPTGDSQFYIGLRKSLSEIFNNILKKNLLNLGEMQKYQVNYYAHGYLGTVYEWLKNGDRTAEEIASFLLSILVASLSQGTGNT